VRPGLEYREDKHAPTQPVTKKWFVSGTVQNGSKREKIQTTQGDHQILGSLGGLDEAARCQSESLLQGNTSTVIEGGGRKKCSRKKGTSVLRNQGSGKAKAVFRN